MKTEEAIKWGEEMIQRDPRSAFTEPLRVLIDAIPQYQYPTEGCLCEWMRVAHVMDNFARTRFVSGCPIHDAS